jgi:hypothetical protein
MIKQLLNNENSYDVIDLSLDSITEDLKNDIDISELKYTARQVYTYF